jgi:hypothetical protein
VRANEDTALQIRLDQLTASNWESPLSPAPPLLPPAPDDAPLDSIQPMPELVALPTAPLFLVRQGRIYGQAVAVVAFSPLYQDGDQLKFVTELQATIPATSLLGDDAGAALAAGRNTVSAAAATAEELAQLAPTNPLRTQSGVKVLVQQPGMQQISGQELAAAGLNLATADPATLQLLHNAAPTPLEINGLVAGHLVATSSVRFYAPSAGDRWNLSDTYWVTTASGAPRMTMRTVTAGSAPVRSTVVERGAWRSNKVYSSNLPGVDGDHWFHRQLAFIGGQTPDPVTLTVNDLLPPAAGSATYTFTLSTDAPATFTLQAQLDKAAVPIVWAAQPPNGGWLDRQVPLTRTGSVQNITLSLTHVDSGFPEAAAWLDYLSWEQPAQLNFAGQGAYFSGLAGRWRYNWQNAPQASQDRYLLYDITDPAVPVALTGANAGGFEDGPGGHDYLLAGPGTLQEPTVVAHTAEKFPPAVGAQAVYIAPAPFIPALEPLLAQRRSQGYTAMAVDVQQIYDAWSYGQVSAEAIRSFLRYARNTWPQPPISVVMVGDATWDPHNYEQKEYHTIFVPPYLAHVDPWLGEAACENCFGQLDGNDPLTGDQVAGSSLFAPDVWVGRFPVKSSYELSKLINKLIRYENNQAIDDWRNVLLFVADNYVKQLDKTGKPVYDAAGDFAHMSDLMIRRVLCMRVQDPVMCTFTGSNSDDNVTSAVLQKQIQQLMSPAELRATRYYYDPYPKVSDPAGAEGWRIANAALARQNVINALSWGAGLVVYVGHSHHWQWAGLDTDPSLLGLLGINDPDALANQDRLFIALSMTCLTAQFQKPANSGTTLDERLFLAQNGAAAVWGPAGLSVVHGHDALQRGFFRALSTSKGNTPLGELVASGYVELMTTSTCCQDALQTFLLLGDPLTPARLLPLDVVHLPLVSK